MGLINEEKLGEAYTSRLSRCHGVTIVAFYGREKPEPYLELVDEIIDQIPPTLRDWLTRYDVENIHATIIGLEGQATKNGRIIHDGLVTRLGGLVEKVDSHGIDFEGVVNFFRQISWPIRIQVGGFGPRDTNPYDPERPPFERAFDIQDNGLIVTMGWPVAAELKSFQPTIVGIRKYLERFNVVHKYHVRPNQQDNDLFFVLGSVNFEKWREANIDERGEAEQGLLKLRTKVREVLEKEPRIIEIRLEDIRVIEYFYTTLSEVGLNKRLAEVNADDLRRIYTH